MEATADDARPRKKGVAVPLAEPESSVSHILAPRTTRTRSRVGKIVEIQEMGRSPDRCVNRRALGPRGRGTVASSPRRDHRALPRPCTDQIVIGKRTVPLLGDRGFGRGRRARSRPLIRRSGPDRVLAHHSVWGPVLDSARSRRMAEVAAAVRRRPGRSAYRWLLTTKPPETKDRGGSGLKARRGQIDPPMLWKRRNRRAELVDALE